MAFQNENLHKLHNATLITAAGRPGPHTARRRDGFPTRTRRDVGQGTTLYTETNVWIMLLLH